METYRSGHNGADSKSVCEQSHVGSNPTVSAKNPLKYNGFKGFLFCLISQYGGADRRNGAHGAEAMVPAE